MRIKHVKESYLGGFAITDEVNYTFHVLEEGGRWLVRVRLYPSVFSRRLADEYFASYEEAVEWISNLRLL